MSFFDILSSGLTPLASRRLKVVSHPPIWAELTSVRPKRDGATVRAWRAQRTGELETGHGALAYKAGRDWIVDHGGHEFTVVRGDIFERMYRLVEGDRFTKRLDLVLRYFTLPERVIVKTLEGPQTAEPGDWIVQGVKGELWPMRANRAMAKYEPI